MIRTQAYNEALFTNNIGLSTVDINFNYLAFLSTTQVLNDLSNLGSVPTEIDRILIDDTNMSYLNSVFKFDFTIDSAEVVCATSETATPKLLAFSRSIFMDNSGLLNLRSTSDIVKVGSF